MQSTSLIILVAIQFVGLALVGWSVLQIHQFIGSTPKLGRENDLIRFKEIIADNMHITLATIPMLGGPWSIYLFGILTSRFDLSDLWLFVLPSLGYPLLGLVSSRQQKRLSLLPAKTSELKQQQDQILTCWKSRAMPDWK